MPTFKSYDEMFSHNDRIKAKHNLKSIFSVTERGKTYTQPSFRTRATTINGERLPDKCYFVEDADDFWGGEDTKPFKKLVRKPTWLALWKLTDEQMEATGDYHHVFLEGVYKTDQEINGIPVYKLCLGS